MQTRPPEDRSIGELFAELARETTSLVRKEIELARAEITQNVTRMGSGVGWLVGAGLFAFLGVQLLLATVVLALAEAMAPWLAALCVAAAVLLIAFALFSAGRSRLRAASLVPRRTIETLKDDGQWAREQLR